jgi:hypothetical protein
MKKAGTKNAGKQEKAVKTSKVKKGKSNAAVRELPSERMGVPPTTPDVDAKVAATEARARKKTVREDGTMSGLDAAAKILVDAGGALNCKAMVDQAIKKGYWKPGGKTPAATMYAAILREIQKKGDASRFVKTERGMFKVKA